MAECPNCGATVEEGAPVCDSCGMSLGRNVSGEAGGQDSAGDGGNGEGVQHDHSPGSEPQGGQPRQGQPQGGQPRQGQPQGQAPPQGGRHRQARVSPSRDSTGSHPRGSTDSPAAEEQTRSSPG